MERMLVPWALAGLVAVAWWPRLRRRLDLSRAKHPSVRGHARVASWLAKRVPAYEYSEREFFTVDQAPADVGERRRAAFFRLAEALRQGKDETLKLTDDVRPGISDLQFTSAYRVPFQFSRFAGTHLKTGAFAAQSRGATLIDLDGRVSYDLTGSYGVNVFGHEFYKECLEAGFARARELGAALGIYHPVVADNVGRLQALSGLDEVSFHMSGTEAVMQAVRLARYHTGRSHLVRFCGAYHGWWDDVQPGVGNPARATTTYTLKDIDDASLHVLRTRRDIACVLVNPLQALHPNAGAPSDSTLLSSNRTAHFDRAGYAAWLKKLRAVCSERGIVLIFDEVFVGFRLAKRGAQEYFDVAADIVTYGKTIAGGLPIGVVCGRRNLMRRFREDRPMDICFARGTFNSHPYVMAAMNEFLRRIDSVKLGAIYADLDLVWDGRSRALNLRLKASGLPVSVAHLSSIWTVLYNSPSCYNWMFQYYLRAEGLTLSWVGTGRLIFNINCSDVDFDAIATRFVAAAGRMKADGWWHQSAALTDKATHRRIVREIWRTAIGRWLTPAGRVPPPMMEPSPVKPLEARVE